MLCRRCGVELVKSNPLLAEDEGLLYKMVDECFVKWFQANVPQDDSRLSSELRSFAQGPAREVKCYKGCIVNEFRFFIKGHSHGRTTQNFGVMVPSAVDTDLQYYGHLLEVLELTYWGDSKLVLFNCDWIDPNLGVKFDNKHKLTEVNCKRQYKTTEKFVLASQALQVTYINKVSKKMRPSERSYQHVLLIPPRSVFNEDEKDNAQQEEISQTTTMLPAPISLNPVLDDATTIPSNLVVWLECTDNNNMLQEDDNLNSDSQSDTDSDAQ